MLCPNCKTPLSIADRAGIEIDFCPTCRGVWLDRGELDKIIERAAGSMPTSGPPQGYAQPPRPAHHGHGYEYRPRKKKSFLSEIFDFD